MFPSSPTCFLPSTCSVFCTIPCFHTHQPPPSPTPPFPYLPTFLPHHPPPPPPPPPLADPSPTCHISKLSNPLLPLPPLLLVSLLQHATFPGSPTPSSLFLPSSR